MLFCAAQIFQGEELKDSMKALRVISANGVISCAVEYLPLPEPAAGEVVIRGEWSSVNYKDALAATGAGKIMKSLPLTGGVDVAGVVEASGDARFQPGDVVLVTGYGLGVEIDGGFAEYARVPADWVVRLPEGLSAFQAMALGTAGFTAGLAVMKMEHMGLTPGAGPVIVTGATGGVGSLAVDMLAGRGYEVVAISGKPEQAEYLAKLGAARVIDRKTLEMGTRPLEKAQWAGAVDTVGGGLLAWLTRSMATGGVIAACGLAGGVDLQTTVMPFILRGVSLLGIDSVACPMAERVALWRRLASDLRPRHLDSGIARTVKLAALPGVFQGYLDGTVTGRTVVDLQ
jgi:NADPH2:quinone reductase